MEDFPFPNLPFQKREKKPRNKGINYVRAPVMVGQCINDYLSAYGNLVDIFKLSGKQAAMMSRSSLVDFISLQKTRGPRRCRQSGHGCRFEWWRKGCRQLFR